MGGGHCYGIVGKASGHCHGGHEQTFCHGGAGSVQSNVGNSGIAQSKGGAYALIQQVTGEHKAKISGLHAGFPGKNPKGLLLHIFFGLLPGGLAEVRVLGRFVKGMAQRAFRLFFSGDTGPGRNDGWLRKGKALAASLVIFHGYTPFEDTRGSVFCFSPGGILVFL